MEYVGEFRNGLLTGDVTINKQSQQFLYDREWLKNIKSQCATLNQIENFRKSIEQKESTLSEALHLWLGMEFDGHDSIMFSDTRILAYMLDHRFRGNRLTSVLKFRASTLVLKCLKENSENADSKDEYKKFLEYRNSDGNFKAEFDDLSCEDFWGTFEHYAPKLSAMGKLYTSLPAGLCLVDDTILQMNDHHLYGEKHSKALFIRHFLE